jgi:transcriptional regulator with XRE-family HTH domain
VLPETFRSLLLRHRGRTGLIQRELGARAGVSRGAVQEWEAGVNYPTAARLRALIRVLLETGAFTGGQEASEARELWATVEREAPHMRTPFDEMWFAALLSANAAHARISIMDGPRTSSAGTAVAHAEDWGEAPGMMGFVGRTDALTLLRRWVLDDRFRLVAVLGMGGVGKTTLTAKLAQEVAPDFEYVYWRSVRDARL